MDEDSDFRLENERIFYKIRVSILFQISENSFIDLYRECKLMKNGICINISNSAFL